MVRVESSAVLARIAAVAPVWFDLDALAPDAPTGVATPDAARAMAGLREQLTRRQFDIAMGVLAGLTNKAIARRLGLSHFTVRNHLSRIMLLMGLQRRRELQDWLAARSAGLT